LAAIHARRVTIMPRDMYVTLLMVPTLVCRQIVRRIRGE